MATVDPQLLRAAVDAVKALGKSVVNDKGTRIGLGFGDGVVRAYIVALLERKLGAPILTELMAKEVEPAVVEGEAVAGLVSDQAIEVKA